MRIARIAAAFLLPACSLVGVERPPPSVEADVRVICTDNYWLPAADLIATAGATAVAAYVIHRDNEACARDRELCDGQTGMAGVLPIPFVVSGVVGAMQVRRCRAMKRWQRSVVIAPMAGKNGAPCIPMYGREGRCVTGYCVRGLCQADMPPKTVRQVCAEPMARWRGETDPNRRARRLAELPPSCRALMRPMSDRPHIR